MLYLILFLILAVTVLVIEMRVSNRNYRKACKDYAAMLKNKKEKKYAKVSKRRYPRV